MYASAERPVRRLWKSSAKEYWDTEMWIYQIGRVIAERRRILGLSESLLAKLAAVSEIDLAELEGGRLQDISHQTLCHIMAVLGLAFELPTVSARCAKNGLLMAARNASVSYKTEISADVLREILESGIVPDLFRSNMIHFLDETPIPMVVMAAEEVAKDLSQREIVWSNLQRLAVMLDSSRKDIWN